MAFEREQRVVAAHARAVVGHADEAASARADFHGDFLRPGVQGIFHQLLHDAGGPLHHFAGGDLVGNLFGKKVDAIHSKGILRCAGRFANDRVSASGPVRFPASGVRPAGKGGNGGHAPDHPIRSSGWLTTVLPEGNFFRFGQQHVSSAGFPTPTSLASAARIFFIFPARTNSNHPRNLGPVWTPGGFRAGRARSEKN
jgi:hypothetical protein